MNAPTCEFEPVVLRAVRLGVADSDLREHAAACADCGELLEIAGMLATDRREAMREAPLPGAGALWFKMQLRARRETVRRSSRATAAIQGLSLIVALAAALLVFGIPKLDFPSVAELSALPWGIPLIALAVAGLLVSVALWFALRRPSES